MVLNDDYILAGIFGLIAPVVMGLFLLFGSKYPASINYAIIIWLVSYSIKLKFDLEFSLEKIALFLYTSLWSISVHLVSMWEVLG